MLLTKINLGNEDTGKMTFGSRSSPELLKCNIWAESDCTTNLCADYHKLINYEVMMCPNGLIIPFSQTAYIVLSKSSASHPVTDFLNFSKIKCCNKRQCLAVLLLLLICGGRNIFLLLIKFNIMILYTGMFICCLKIPTRRR